MNLAQAASGNSTRCPAKQPSVIVHMMLEKIKNGWLKVSHILAVINSYILLSIIFFLVITPIGIIYRIFHKSILRKQPAESFRIKRSTETELERPF